MIEEEPWWYRKCVHSWRPLEDWEVVREAEQVVILYDKPFMVVHLLVQYQDWGSCTPMSLKDYVHQLDGNEPALMEYIRSQINFLRSVHS